jgi:hypothetical protein
MLLIFRSNQSNEYLSKTIAIIELYQHDEVLRHYCDLLSDSSYNIKVFCSKSVYESLGDHTGGDHFQWFIKDEKVSIPKFLKANYSTIRACDLVFITTALNHFKAFYEFSKINKTLLLVHNAHSFLAPRDHLALNPQKPVSDWLRLLKVYFNRSHFYKKKMLDSLIGLAFPTETILNYVQEKFDLPRHLKLLNLPFAYFQKREKVQQQKITITIPCTVNSELRDYQSVLNAIQQIKELLTEQIQLVLLGMPKDDGKEIIKSFTTLNHDEIEVITFNNFIPFPAYQKWLLSTDFLILPLKEYGRNHIYKEHIGYSKISGGINDMIRFGVPALMPEHYPVDDDLKQITHSYNNTQELSRLILNWVGTKRKAALGTLSSLERTLLKQQFDQKINGLLGS